MDTPPQKPNPDSGIDPSSYLLPKKEVPKVQSAQRVSAGILLKQEQEAELKPTPAIPQEKPAAVTVPPTSVRAVETYQGDMEKYVQEKKVSVVTVAAAQANRRGIQTAQMDAAMGTAGSMDTNASPQRHFFAWFFKIIGGLLLLAGAAGIVAYLYIRSMPVSIQNAAQAPFISVDDSAAVNIPADSTSAQDILTDLENTKNTLPLSVGLVEQLVPTVVPTSTQQKPTIPDAQTFLGFLVPNIPQILLRDINPTYLLGLHVYDTNQPFLILSVDSYEQAYSGMLAWEATMQQDLSPLFTYTPPPTMQTVQINTTVSTTTATSTTTTTVTSTTTNTLPIQTSTATTTGTTTRATLAAPTPQPGFVDQIVDNHDARVILDANGNIILLWTFLDKNTIVITTNEHTLNEIISRLKAPPVLPSVSQ